MFIQIINLHIFSAVNLKCDKVKLIPNRRRDSMTLSKEVKEGLEKAINDWLSRFDEIAEAELNFLERIGIEPKHETLLSYTAGVLDSSVGSFIHCLYDRGMTEEEDKEMIELLKRKIPVFELKFKAFLRENKPPKEG
jgi:hypothetical protein